MSEFAQKQNRRTRRRRGQADTELHSTPLQHKIAPETMHTKATVLHLQQTIGNRATQRLLQKKQTPKQKNVVQRFGSDEHREIGDDATRDKHGNAQTVELSPDYSITYGEMIALAGDYFGSIDEMRTLAGIPGTGEGTREEIEYARVVHVGGQQNREGSFSSGARDAVMRRYYALAMKNRSHFVNPETGDENRSTAEKSGDTVEKWVGTFFNMRSVEEPLNGPAGYRMNHVRALFEAYYAGMNGQGVDSAMAAEAFGAHFLTDAFAAGHLRTPRASINEHWNKRVPMFNYNLKGMIAERLAAKLEKTIAGGIFTQEAIFKGPLWFDGALHTVTQTLDSKGMISFGDVVSGAVHDYDNEKGVIVDIAGATAELFGDSHLGEGSEKDYAMLAVQAGRDDVLKAWEAGQKRGDPLALAGQLVRDGLFAAERLIPTPLPDEDLPEEGQRVRWDFDSVDDLLNDRRFKQALTIFITEKAGEFEKAADGLDKDQKAAFLEEVVKPLKANPIGMVRQVINWTPNTGGGVFGHNQDDNAMDYIEKVKELGALDTLTVQQRVRLLIHLAEGATMGDEEDAMYEVLTSTPRSEIQAVIDGVGWDRLEDEIGRRFRKRYPEDTYKKRKR